MSINADLARWNEPPATVEEEVLADLVDALLAQQRRGEALNLVELLQRHPECVRAGQDLLTVVDCLHQFAASVLEYSELPEDQTSRQGTATTSWEDPALPQPFPGEYHVQQLLGEGGFSKVWLAQDCHLAIPVALKTLLLQGDAQRQRTALAALQNEARVLARLDHPHIVRVFALRPANNDYYLILQYVAGGSLDQRVRRSGPLTWEQGARYVADVGEALLAVHRQGLLHRDIKPANILWDPLKDEALLTDFGLAARLSDDPTSAGTPLFMALEAFHGQGGAPADVYGLAATLFFLLTGQPPFAAPSRRALQQKIAQGLPASDPRCASLPEALERLLRAGLAVQPEDRPPLEVFLATLRGLLNQLLADTLMSRTTSGRAAITLRLLVSRQEATQRFVPVATTHPQQGQTRDMKKVPPTPERVVLRTGERVRIEVLSSHAGYLSVFNVGPTGNLHLLYPDSGTPGTIEAARPLPIVDVEMTPPAGHERLFALWSERPLPVEPDRLLQLAAPATQSREYRATRSLEQLQDSVLQLAPEHWQAVVLELDHQNNLQ